MGSAVPGGVSGSAGYELFSPGRGNGSVGNGRWDPPERLAPDVSRGKNARNARAHQLVGHDISVFVQTDLSAKKTPVAGGTAAYTVAR